MKNKNITKPLKDFMADITKEEREFIDQEKKYYEIVVALRKKREKMGLTQAKLAELSNIPRTTITKVESGTRNATLQTLMSLARAMGSRFEMKLR
jgi:DNA-binding XRE family transcriptional regulator